MNVSLRNLLLVVIALALLPAVYAFESTLTLQGGVNIPHDDIEGENELMASWGLSWEAWVTKALGIGVNPYFTNLLVKPGDGDYGYSSSIEGVDVYLKLRPDRILAINFSEEAALSRISPFIALGAGYAAHGSKTIMDTPYDNSNEYMVVLPHLAAGISFLTKANSTFDLGVKYNYTDTDIIDMIPSGDWNDGYFMPYVGLGIHFGTRQPPQIVVDGAFSRFGTELGTPSAPQSYNISGKRLKEPITITAPDGYELSIDGGRSWTSSATLDPRSDRPVLVRMTGLQSGVFQGQVLNASPGAALVRMPLTGVVVAPREPARINISGNISGFTTEVGTPSDPQPFNLSGTNLEERINLRAPNGYELSTDGGKTWGASTSLDPDYVGTIWVRLTGAQMGRYEGIVETTSAGALSINLPVSGVVGEFTRTPRIGISGNLSGFSTEKGTPSEPQSYNINGSNLSGWITITAPNGYEISIDGGQTWVPTGNVDASFSGPVWIRMTGLQTGAFQGFVMHTSAGVENAMLPVSGNVNEHPEMVALEEDLYIHIVHFPTNEYLIPAEDKLFLDRVAESMKKLPNVRIQVQGHTDSTGGDKINIPLSLNRAKFVRDYLINRGIDIARIDVKGFASERPVESNDTKEGRRANRRADIVIVD
ncbi:MAG: OmpA family protein [Candidatus Syntrophosphaera sp.]|nr:OmpA family protein [Candidatus Syntrophosphaera sp.]